MPHDLKFLTDNELNLITAKPGLEAKSHQIIGVDRLLGHSFFALFDEMGAGKTKQVIDAAQLLYVRADIDTVIVVCPAAVRSVWVEPELGQIKLHAFDNVPIEVWEYHSRTKKFRLGPPSNDPLRFIVTNYDFIRSQERLDGLTAMMGPGTMLVVDESSAVKSHKSLQTKAVMKLRKMCSRVVLLNGTPIANNPLDMYAQGNIMSPNILELKTFSHFKAKYCIMGGFLQKQVVGWQNLEDMQRRFAPYVLRRLKKDCLDLPEKLSPAVISVPLTPATWVIYKQMRDDLVSYLTDEVAAVARHAAVKAIRLSQVTSGFLGGLEELARDPNAIHDDQTELDDALDYTDSGTISELTGLSTSHSGGLAVKLPTREISREKLDAFLDWYHIAISQDKNLKLLVWCRFRAELARLVKEFQLVHPKVEVGTIWGTQKRDEREHALRLLDPRTAPSGPVLVVGTPQTGSMGLNLTAAHTVVYVSNDYSLKTRLQSEDRVHRPGQTEAVSYFDVIACGPSGQRTIDHAIIKALRTKSDIANWTTKAWLEALSDESK